MVYQPDQATLLKMTKIVAFLFVFFFCLTLLISLLAAAAACFRDRKRRLTAIDKTAASYPSDGEILDAQLVQEHLSVPQPLHYKYSIRFADAGGTMHRAFIGISTTRPLYYAAGQHVQLRILQQSVIVPDRDAFDPSRGKNGKLDGLISFRKWLGKPIDETGTVMLEQDYQDVSSELEQKAKSLKTAGSILIWCAGFSVFLTVGAFVALLSEF